jgi:hypothetical protein
MEGSMDLLYDPAYPWRITKRCVESGITERKVSQTSIAYPVGIDDAHAHWLLKCP